MTSDRSRSLADGSSYPARRRSTARTPATLLAAAVLATSVVTAGCMAAADPLDPPTGQLVVPLVQPGPHGELFHLGNATFDIVGNSNDVSTSVDGGGTQSAVSVELPPGLYTITLRDGWFLERSVDGGITFEQVSALLGSPNPNVLRVLANQSETLPFNFLVRNPNGTLEITLGVDPKPRELAGGVVIETATGGLAAYADPGNQTLDFGIFFTLAALVRAFDEGVTPELIYTAGPDQVFGPVPPTASAVAIEFYNDRLGLLSGPIAAELNAGNLFYTVAAEPNGTFVLAGSLQSVASLTFGPHAIDAVLPTLDDDGFPADVFFYDSESPFTLTTSIGTLTGVLRVRHLLPPP
jgi:hypothetical protein